MCLTHKLTEIYAHKLTLKRHFLVVRATRHGKKELGAVELKRYLPNGKAKFITSSPYRKAYTYIIINLN